MAVTIGLSKESGDADIFNASGKIIFMLKIPSQLRFTVREVRIFVHCTYFELTFLRPILFSPN